MNRPYSNYWWVYLVRGIFAVSFSIITLILPGPAFATLVIFFGVFMITDGIFSILFSVNKKNVIKSRQWLIFTGLTDIVAGILVLFNPLISAITLVSLFALWSFFAGIREMISFRKQKRKEAWYVLCGIVSILIAILLLINPPEGVSTLAIVFGIYALVIGISLISLSIKLNKYFRAEKERGILA